MIKDNYNITNLFLTKKVKIFVDNNYFYIQLPTIAELTTLDSVNSSISLWTLSTTEQKKLLPINIKSSWEFMKEILFSFGFYQEFSKVSESFKEALTFILPDLVIDYKEKELKIKDLIINEEIWDYILYLLKLSYGEKVEKPLTFESEEARQFYLAQKANEEKIQALRNKQNKGKDDSLIKAFLSIIYAFPSLTIDYLFNQTMAQIQWLQKYAAGAVSYEVNAKAFAAGNIKKGSKLDFFIK